MSAADNARSDDASAPQSDADEDAPDEASSDGAGSIESPPEVETVGADLPSEGPASAGGEPVSTTATGPSRRSAAGSSLDLRAVVAASLAAGALFLALELAASLVWDATPFGPARATLKSLFGFSADQITASGITGTLVVHFGLALLTTFVLALVVGRWKTYVAVPLGLAFGGFLYTANVLLLSFVAPAPFLTSDLTIIANYGLYGAASAWVYKARQRS
jgi:hypothetical protein